ncbi:hypothetical protein E2562_009014 [Oryza meyeriana var. granulata]|uniref:Uncharacterized protein n=1 Tax=Oryza meyeriana var. granulata TaxID=110450 RepID=A0A6G1D2M4_9ORYZ|nr:hypothetical protein E2562_009014 [Oryza meyeriana var. granulata]
MVGTITSNHNLKGARVAVAVHVAFVGIDADHGAEEDDFLLVVDLRWYGHVEALASGGVLHDDLMFPPIENEDAPMTTAEQIPVVIVLWPQGEALERDEVWRVMNGPEDGLPAAVHEDAEERGLAVVGSEAAEEGRVGDEAAPTACR